MTPVSERESELVTAINQIGACWTQANLCSTASDEERRQFIVKITETWNKAIVPILTEKPIIKGETTIENPR